MRNPACTKCALHVGVLTVCVEGTGPRNADIMLVGEAPGADEDRLGVPFMGQAGGILDDCLREVGIPRDSVFITNPIRCRPPGNRDPSTSEIAACYPYLAAEIDEIKPKVIVAMGAIAVKTLIDTSPKARGERYGSSIKDLRGKQLPAGKNVRSGDAKLIVSYHPAAYLHNRNELFLTAIKEDLTLAKTLAGRRESNLPEHERIFIMPDAPVEELVAALMELNSCSEVSVDCEWTAGADNEDGQYWPWRPGAEFHSMSISGQVDNRIISIGIAWTQTAAGQRAIQAFLSKKRLVFHNAMADLIWLTALGFKLVAADDTQFLAYLQNEEQRLNLDRLAALICGIADSWKTASPMSLPHLRARRPTSPGSWRELLIYNTDDTYATLLVKAGLYAQVRAKDAGERANIGRAYYKLLLPALPSFVAMALNGAPIHAGRLAAAIIERENEATAIANRVALEMGLHDKAARELLSSTDKLADYLKRAFGLNLPDTRAETLEPYADDYPIVRDSQDYRHAHGKLNGTYLVPWQKIITRNREHRLHSIYRLDRTRTGRTSAGIEMGGSIQLAPRELWLRQLIEDDMDDDWVVLSADYSQIELRMIAWLAPERTMRRLFNEGADLHRATAAFIKAFGKQRISVADFWRQREDFMADVTATERQNAKPVNFGFDFGMGAEKFVKYSRTAYGVEFTLEEAQDARRGYFNLYSDLADWHERCQYDLARGWVTMPFGRYRRNIQDVTQMINTPIQTTANDLAVFATSAIFEQFESYTNDVRLSGYVHDSIIVLTRAHLADEIKGIIKATMEHPPLERVGIEIPVPLVADVKIGKNWGDAS